MKIYLVTGVHWEVPNQRQAVALSRPAAEVEALKMVNILREDTDLAPACEGSDWLTCIRNLQRWRIAKESGQEYGQLAEVAPGWDDEELAEAASCWVVIDEFETVDQPTGLLELRDAAAEITSQMSEAMNVHVYDDHDVIPEDCRYLRAIVRTITAVDVFDTVLPESAEVTEMRSWAPQPHTPPPPPLIEQAAAIDAAVRDAIKDGVLVGAHGIAGAVAKADAIVGNINRAIGDMGERESTELVTCQRDAADLVRDAVVLLDRVMDAEITKGGDLTITLDDGAQISCVITLNRPSIAEQYVPAGSNEVDC